MNTTLTKLAGLARQIKVELPIESFQIEVKKELNKLSKTMKLDGFRPGKVPIKIVESRFGASIKSEIAQKMISDILPKVFAQESLSPAATPNLTKLVLDDKEFLKFTLDFDVFPEVTLLPIEQLSFNQIQAEVGQQDIEKTLTDLRKQHATLTQVDRESQQGDSLNIDFTGTVDNKPFSGSSAKDFNLTLGDKKMIDQFEQGLIGKQSGQKVSLEITFPDNYQVVDLSNKKAVFLVKINHVSSVELPELNEELAKKYNEDSVKNLTKNVKEHLLAQLNKEIEHRNKETVINALVEANPIEIPESSINDEANNLLKDMKQRLDRQQVSPKKMRADLFNDEAKKRLQLGLLFSKIVDKTGIKVTQEAIDQHIKNIAQQNNQSENSMKSWYDEDKSRLAQVESLLIEEAVISHIVKNAQVTNSHKTFKEIANHD